MSEQFGFEYLDIVQRKVLMMGAIWSEHFRIEWNFFSSIQSAQIDNNFVSVKVGT